MIYLLSVETLITLFFIIVSIILVPYFYIKVINGMTTRILKRIISTNFSVSANKILSLSFGYFAGTVLYASVIYQLYVYKFLPIDESQVPSLTIASALCFCFTARVISREYGYANGKQYLAALGASASIIFIINTVIYINSIDTSTIIYAIYHIPTLFTYLYSKILNLVAAVLILSKSLFQSNTPLACCGDG